MGYECDLSQSQFKSRVGREIEARAVGEVGVREVFT